MISLHPLAIAALDTSRAIQNNDGTDDAHQEVMNSLSLFIGEYNKAHHQEMEQNDNFLDVRQITRHFCYIAAGVDETTKNMLVIINAVLQSHELPLIPVPRQR